MPQRIGLHDNTAIDNLYLEKYLCGPDYVNPGDDCIPSEIKDSGVQIMRYGGNAIETHYDYTDSPAQYLEMVNNMITNGIEPVLQVPYGDGTFLLGDGTMNTKTAAEVAAELVTYINITNDKDVKYWSIGNEPNQPGKGFTTAQIATYFRDISKAMKDVDSTIIVTGPDLSFYDPAFIEPLTDCADGDPNGTFGLDDITGSFIAEDDSTRYYVDILNFHTYPFDAVKDIDEDGDIDDDDKAVIAYTRADVIAKLADDMDGFQEKLDLLQGRVEDCNTAHRRRGKSALKKAITEMNVTLQNPTPEALEAAGVDEWESVGATSFLAGQFWAEAMSIGMRNGLEGITFWSVSEGDNLGYIKDDGTKLSTYYHFQMMAKHFRGEYAAGTDSVNNADVLEVKAFGSKAANRIVVMILNQTTSVDYDYTVRFDTDPVSGAGPLKINIDAEVAAPEYNSSAPINRESTVMLVFNRNGALQKRYVYSLADAQAGSAPTPCTTGC